MQNLYDLTRGNYRVHRVVSYPEFPGSRLEYQTEVRSAGDEWSTKIDVTGTYDAPTEVLAVRDYRVEWTTDGKVLSEEGTATLVLSSGSTLRTQWSSSIVPRVPRFDRFPRGGQTIEVTYSTFEIEGNTMSYEWEGTVQAGDRYEQEAAPIGERNEQKR